MLRDQSNRHPDSRWAPGGMYDTSTVTLGDRTRCFTLGHDVRAWGTITGWCHRCKHSVHTYSRKRVLYHGEFHSFPPAHEENLIDVDRDRI